MKENKERHGCLTAWLVFLIIANAASALLYLVASDAIRQTLPIAPGWVFPLLAVVGIFNLVCAIALLRWKKWGFYGFVVSSIVALVINLSIGLGIVQSLAGLLGLAILYGLLHLGKENKAWPQLD
jgi:hypothetical protein